jgi:uncharacterized protein (DUF608 family)
MGRAWPILRRYTGEHLREIALPLGGIGTGFFSLGGRGQLTDFQLMSRPNRGWKPLYAHFLLWTKQGDTRKLRVLEGDLDSGFASDGGHPEVFAAFPRFEKAAFEATFPFGRVKLEDGDTPVDVSIEGWNPLIPKQTDDSSLPLAVLSFTIRNKTREPVDASVSFILTNFIGVDGREYDLKDSITESLSVDGWHGMHWWKDRTDVKPTNGTMAILCDAPDVKVARQWKFRDLPWSGERLGIQDEILAKGFIDDDQPGVPCPPSPKDTWDGSVHALVSLKPNEEKQVTFLVTWHFPHRNVEVAWNFSGSPEDRMRKNHYATRFQDATDVARKTISRLPELKSQSIAFIESVLRRQAPTSVKEAALFNLSVLKSHTCFRLEDGSFFAFEGCNGDSGCCSGSCTHVWNYEQATVDLFPDLHRSMLENHLTYGVTPEGAQRFRQSIPVKNATWGLAAADGQMGMVVRTYQQYLADKDMVWLRTFYLKAKKLLEFAWEPNGWDGDQDGVFEGSQHNTYDVEFFGPNPMCTVYYLAALSAAAKMADLCSDGDFAKKCRELVAKGSKWVDENLYNGRFYFQKVHPSTGKWAPFTGGMGPTNDPPFQVGPGCLIDQLVGQYKANRAGLGDLLDRFHITNSLKSTYRYNYKQNFRDHYHNMRTYVAPDERGTLICSYPDGGRPAVPFPYWGECMTGFEYMFAALLLDYGLKKQGLDVAKAVRDRHDGRRRNPFNEPECGSYYARSMAAWALLDAWDRT